MDKINLKKMKLESSNIADENFEKLASLFPNVVTETIVNDRVERVIDVDKLKQEINSHVVEGLEERYNFTWPDKRKSVVLANAPTRNTLRACKEESKDFDKTENLYIEGDNLEVLKLLRNTYMGQIKMIYIDPPYNTGKDFVYKDNFFMSKEDYLENSGQVDENGNKYFPNTETNGRFHTDWLNMMYPRLKMARDLLSDDGVIFISIDDNELENLTKICNEIFGERNFVACCIRRTINSGKHDTNTISTFHEYILIYSKNILQVNLSHKLKDEQERDRLYNLTDEYVEQRGRFYITQLNKNTIQYSDSLNYPIKCPDNSELWPGDGFDDKRWVWRWSKEKVKWGIDNGYIVFKQSKNGLYKIYTKSYEFVDNNGNHIERTNPYTSLEFISKEYGNFSATPELESLFEKNKFFDFPKSVVFIKELCKIVTKNDIILDFFSGSATTAHAVMQLNAEDGGGGIGNL